ncbi:hypothetical protein J1N35_001013 [Gossypium stocksii]|uniref:Transcription initiation factor IIF subunit alpha n=1 Tax=Gossypium stocksii TaxID=47602 RepID=A0A9D3WIR5_9ROSI|nr:hypothetical protein J1N35_001013 [Gossypium stocksii]
MVSSKRWATRTPRSQSATYYLLMMQGKEFLAIPAGSWYNFNKVAQYKQLTLEEVEVKMKNRRKTADGYERWMMKAANNGVASFGEIDSGLMTPTMKIRRDQVVAKHKEEITNLYKWDSQN